MTIAKIDVEKLRLIFDCIQVTVTIITLLLAGIGLKLWQRQLKGTHLFDLANRIGKGLLRCLRQVSLARSIFTSAHEQTQAMVDFKIDFAEKSVKEKLRLGNFAVTSARHNQIVKCINELDSLFLEGEVFWQKEFKDLVTPLMDLLRKICLDFQIRADSTFRELTLSDELEEKLTATLYELKDDEISTSLKKEVGKILEFLSPYLLSKYPESKKGRIVR